MRDPGPKQFTRAGVLLTIMCIIILTEFVYFPAFAVPAFKQTEWSLTMNVTRPPVWPSVPSVVIFQTLGPGFDNQAQIPADDQAWQSVCQNGIETDKNPNQSCVANNSAIATLTDGTQIAYAVYHPKYPFETLQLFAGMDFFYPFNCK